MSAQPMSAEERVAGDCVRLDGVVAVPFFTAIKIAEAHAAAAVAAERELLMKSGDSTAFEAGARWAYEKYERERKIAEQAEAALAEAAREREALDEALTREKESHCEAVRRVGGWEMSKSIEERVRALAYPARDFGPGLDVVAHTAAIRIARDYAEDRARPLREALETAQVEIQGIQGLRRGNSPYRVYADGLFNCERIDALANQINAALAAEAEARRG